MHWNYGTQFTRNLRLNKFYGRSGQIEFNKLNGLRNNIRFIIIDKLKNSIDMIGNWRENRTTTERIRITRKFHHENEVIIKKINRRLTVATVIVNNNHDNFFDGFKIGSNLY